MTTNTLFATLMRSIYSLSGCEGEFLADLTRPIPYTQSGAEVREGVLARLPSTLHRQMVDAIEWHETSILEEIEFAMEDRDDDSVESLIEILTDLDSPSQTVLHVRELRGDLRTLRAELATL